MKTNILKSAVLASILAMTACTTQIVEINPDLDNGLALGQGEDIIRIALTNTTNTRAARPIGTSKAENNVNRIAFKFLTNGRPKPKESRSKVLSRKIPVTLLKSSENPKETFWSCPTTTTEAKSASNSVG